MRQFGRGLQMAALVMLPLTMILQIADAVTVKQMLICWLAGGSLFFIGRIAEGYARA